MPTTTNASSSIATNNPITDDAKPNLRKLLALVALAVGISGGVFLYAVYSSI